MRKIFLLLQCSVYDDMCEFFFISSNVEAIVCVPLIFIYCILVEIFSLLSIR
jgi:hypothetical protein